MLDIVGQRLGEFEIVAYLGEGAHVHAYLAKQPSKNREVVIKILKSSLAKTQEFVERFKREAQAAVELNHPNIVPVYEYHQEGDILYIVEAFLTGGSLWDIFRKTPGAPLPIDKTISTLEDLGAGLDYAHEKGIIHGDIKPENILYSKAGRAALSDLGITKDIDQKAARSRDALAFGNPGYMSPEEWRGEPADARTDIYAIGILLFEMLTGQLPFDTVFTGSLAYTHLMHLVTKPIDLASLRPDLPPSVGDIIHKAMEKERDQRYPTLKAMVADFKAALKGDGKAPEKSERIETPAQPPSKPSLFAGIAQAITPKAESVAPPASQSVPKPSANGDAEAKPAWPGGEPVASKAVPAEMVPVYERANFWLMLLAFVVGFLVAQLLEASRDE